MLLMLSFVNPSKLICTPNIYLLSSRDSLWKLLYEIWRDNCKYICF